MSNEMQMSLTEFLNSESNMVSEYFSSHDQIRTRAPSQESFNYNHGMSRGPPLPGMNIIVPGQPAHPFPGPHMVCRPPLHNTQRPPPIPHLPHPGPLTHPPPIPPLAPHHLPHGPPPPHIGNLPRPPYGVPRQGEPGRLPPPHGPQLMQTSLHRPPPPGHIPVLGPSRHGPSPLPRPQPAAPPFPCTQSAPPPLPYPQSAPPLPLCTQSAPPPLPSTQSVPPPPLPPDKLQMQPPLPPLPPLPPSVNDVHSKPPLPKGPPPSSTSASNSSMSSSFVKPIKSSTEAEIYRSSKDRHSSSFKRSTKNMNFSDKDPKPIPSIITPWTSSKPATIHSSSSKSRLPSSAVLPVPVTAAAVKDPTPPSQPLPSSVTTNTLITLNHSSNLSGVTDEAYDPEDATFSPTSSQGSPSEENLEESLINKYVKRAGKAHASDRSPGSLKFQERNGKDKKKRVSFSKDVSFTEKSSKSPAESPVRPNLDARLKIMFGGVSDDEKSPKKAKKSVSQHNAPYSLQGKEEGTENRPLSPTPSPFLSRHLYLYWHKETLKAKKEYKLFNVDGACIKASCDKVKSKHNGQVITVPPPLHGIPPLPKNLPTVPPPNYMHTLAEPPLKEGNFKVEMLKNIKRMHPYKVCEAKLTCLKNSMDTEFELTSAAPSDSFDEISSVRETSDSQEETVRLVMAKILDDLKCIIRQELTKNLIDTKVKECLKDNKKLK